MAVSEKQKKYSDKYIKSTFDEIKLRVPKGKKIVIKEFAEKNGESLNCFLNRLISDVVVVNESDLVKKNKE